MTGASGLEILVAQTALWPQTEVESRHEISSKSWTIYKVPRKLKGQPKAYLI
jgi:hypothetical protein